MNMTDACRSAVAGWIKEKLSVGRIQALLGSEFDIDLTYMEVHMLLDDLKLTPDSPSSFSPLVAVPDPSPNGAADQTAPPAGAGRENAAAPPGKTPPKPGCVRVKADEIARPGAMVSGSVVFSDGQRAAWVVDQMGRMGVIPDKKGYKPSQADLQDFQVALETELAKLGF